MSDENIKEESKESKEEHHAHHHKEGEHTHHTTVHHATKKESKDYTWQILSGILAVLLVVAIFTNGFRGNTAGGTVASLTKEKAGEQAISYVNKNLLPAGTSATLKNVAEEASYYKVTLDIGGKQYDSYMTKDGKTFFPSGIDMTKEVPTTPTDAQPEQPADYSTLEKVAKPKMTIWIESRCPFGTQAANGASYVKNLLGANANIELRYMVSKTATGVQAMHGEAELAEDKREICIREEQSDKFWTYMKCYAETGKPEDCEKSTKVDSTKLKDCVDKRSVALLTKDADDWKNTYVPLGGSGSPSFFLNDKKINEYSFSSNGRSPENLKQILCNSMTTPVKACDTKLPATNPPRGFGTLDAGAATDVAQANCG